jgi:hypothetical protein
VPGRSGRGHTSLKIDRRHDWSNVARLHHAIIPSKDHLHAAQFLGTLFGLDPEPPTHRFPWSPSLTVGGVKLMFCQAPQVPVHLAFHVTPAEFDDILARIQAGAVTHGDNPQDPSNAKIRTDERGHGYRAVWALAPDATLLEFFCFDMLPEGFTDPATAVTTVGVQ